MKALMDNKHLLINALLFQIVWFIAVLQQSIWAALPVGLMLMHLLIVQKRSFWRVASLVLLAFIGVSLDSVFNFIGIYHFSVTNLLLPMFGLPVWLVCLWLGFCLTLPLSLAWLIKKPYFFVLGCTLLGPISYLAGRRFEAIGFSDANIWLLVVEWCVFSIIALVFLFPKLGVSKASPIFFKNETPC